MSTDTPSTTTLTPFSRDRSVRARAGAACAICGASMIPRPPPSTAHDMVAAMARHHHAANPFACPAETGTWHRHAAALAADARAQRTRSVRWLIGEELDRLLRDRGIDARQRAEVQRLFVQPDVD